MRVEQIGNATLYLGDCMELLKLVPDSSVDLVLADLPYGTTQNKWDIALPLADLWREYLRVCKGAFVLTAQTPFDKVLGVSNLAMLRYEWIWEKTNPTGHLNAKKAPMKAHENVLVFHRGSSVYNPIMTQGHPRKTAVKRGDTSPVYGAQQAHGISYDSTQRYPRSVLTFASDKQRGSLHPTQKPLALMDYLVRTYSHQGQTVLDNCFGSGTTAVACLALGRRFVGMERDPDYFQIAVDRLRQSVAPQQQELDIAA